MTRLVLALALVCCAITPARAEPDDDLTQARALFERREFAAARDLLLEAYATSPRPALLFALGQVELNLGHPDQAIAYYERFIATNPGDDQVSLAQQAIGAARMQQQPRATPPPPPPPPLTRRVPPRWDKHDTRLTVAGGLVIAAGATAILYAHHLADDTSGTLADYDARITRAHRWQWTGIASAAAGGLAIGAALLRWRLSGHLEVTAAPTRDGVAVAASRRW